MCYAACMKSKTEISAYNKAYRLKNRANILAREQAFRNANRKMLAEKKRTFRAANPGIYSHAEKRWRENNPEKVKSYWKPWAEANATHLSTYRRKYRKLKKAKLNALRRKKHRKCPNPTGPQRAAYSSVQKALRQGVLIRPANCSSCRKECKPEAHHFKGYDFPLDVQWLCKDCHIAVTNSGNRDH